MKSTSPKMVPIYKRSWQKPDYLYFETTTVN